MNERIKQLAEKAGFYKYDVEYDTRIEYFAELVRQDEREVCLVILETYPTVLEMTKAIRGRTE